jgi:putative glutathione S-transferase
MGVLIEGVWRDEELPQETSGGGEFKRVESRFRDRITADGSSGFEAEAGRYHVYAAWNCPWAHRVLLFLVLKKLQNHVSVAYADPALRERGWTFHDDPANGFRYLYEAYQAADPRYTGKVTVPTLWDKKTRRIVNNESSEIIRMLNSEFNGISGDDSDYYPAALRAEIDRINELVYAKINNGVYRCGFAKTQEAYEAAFDALFGALDEVEGILSKNRFLVGDRPTEADWRLFPTLVRFDPAYFSVFRCNKKRIADYPNLSRYLGELYRVPGVAATVKPRQYVVGYWSIKKVNPSGIIPKGTHAPYLEEEAK